MLKRRLAAVAVSAAALICTGLAAAPADAVGSEGGSQLKLQDNLCLDIPGGKVFDSAQIQQWACNGTRAQMWNIFYVDSTHFLIQSAIENQFCLNNWEGGDRTGNHLRLHACANSADGSFNWVHKGRGTQIQPRGASANCLDAWSGTGQGNEIRLYPCTDAPGENFV
ncbi:ricin-type beta-trefoil lectin domain protein [Streptomyces populi]